MGPCLSLATSDRNVQFVELHEVPFPPPVDPRNVPSSMTLSVRGLTKRYGLGDAQITVLRGVDLAVAPG